MTKANKLQPPKKATAREAREIVGYFWQVLGEIPGERWRFIRAVAYNIIGSAAFYVVIPLLISIIVGQAIETGGAITQSFVVLVSSLVVIVVVAGLFHHNSWLKMSANAEAMSAQMLGTAMSRLLRYTHGFFADRKVGSLVNDIAEYIRSYELVLYAIFPQVLNIAINYILSIAVIAFVAPYMLVPVTLASAYVIFNVVQSSKTRRIYRGKKKEQISKRMGLVSDVLGNHSLVRIFGRREREVESIDALSRKVQYWAREDYVRAQASATRRYIYVTLMQVATIALAVWLLREDLLSVTGLVFVITYLSRLSSMMFGLTSVLKNIEAGVLDAKHMKDILELPIGVEDKPGAKPLKVKKGAIRLKHVSFSYKKHHAESAQYDGFFNNLSLNIPAGQRVGVVGVSGGGKTTLTQLLLRYADVDKGSISIDGQNIAGVTQDSLRGSIAYVPQDPFLFHRTIRENIAYARPHATNREIEAVAKSAKADEFIRDLPSGYNTMIGERGVKLSGGQRQRLAIARAMLLDAPILVLDEATSALDSESEKHIQAALVKLMKGRTAVVVAHRLSTISHLDRIIVLDQGKIVEDGTHAELLKQKGVYAKLWVHQSGGFV